MVEEGEGVKLQLQARVTSRGYRLRWRVLGPGRSELLSSEFSLVFESEQTSLCFSWSEKAFFPLP